MTIKSGLISLAVLAATASLAACGPSGSETAPQEPAVETPEQMVARLATTMGPRAFKLREINCMENVSFSKRLGDRLPADLAAEVAAQEPMNFFAIVRQSRELGIESQEFGEVQHKQPDVPVSAAEVTPEFIANTRECLAIAKVANARDAQAEK